MSFELKKRIESYFESNELDVEKVLGDVSDVMCLLETGAIRVSEQNEDGSWIVNSWIKKAVLLAFKYRKSTEVVPGYFDKMNLKSFDINTVGYRKAPGSIVREGVYIAKGAILMPSYINVGAYIDSGTMIDIYAAVGACAQIGKNCHISAHTVIGGVLEPAVANPVIIEDNCFIGAGASILEGVVVKTGSVISSGVCISGSTKIIDRETGEVFKGIVPSESVVVGGSYQSSNELNINCAVIIKKTDEKSASKTSINSILRK